MARAQLTIDTEACKGCLLCTAACPKDILEENPEMVNRKGYHPVACNDIEACIACGICAIICPDSAIKVERVDL